MKRTYLHLSRASFCFALLAILAITLSATAVSAQANASDWVAAPISTEDLPNAGWKSPVDYAAVVATERNNTATTLADPNLKGAELALYTGYDRLLAYMQADLGASLPIEDIASTNYKKVLTEATSDPVLANMQNADFSALYDGLVAKLTQH